MDLLNGQFPQERNEEFYTEIKRARLDILCKAEKDTELQGLLNQKCRDDIDYFFNAFLWTYDPREKEPEIPFVLYDFQREKLIPEIERAIEQGYDLLIEKARDMGATWCILGVYLNKWLFKGYDFRVGSRKWELVDKRGDMDTLFERLRFMYKRLPKWMKRGTQETGNIGIFKDSSNDTSIVGEATSPNFGVAGRKKSILLDEFAKWDCDEAAWANTADVTPSRIVNSTPDIERGKFCKFYRLVSDKDRPIKKVRLEHQLHPNKGGDWLDNERKRRTDEEVQSQILISYDTATIGKVYPEMETSDLGKYEYSEELPLYTFWDFGEGGADDTAIIWCQTEKIESVQHYYFIDCFSKPYKPINFYAPLVTGLVESSHEYISEELEMINRHHYWKRPINVGDPYNLFKATAISDKNRQPTNISRELEKHNIFMQTCKRSESVRDRIERVRLNFQRAVLHFDEKRCEKLLIALQNARWPMRKETSQSTAPITKPIHDFTSHFRTALEYGIAFLEGEKKREQVSKRLSGWHKPKSKGNPYATTRFIRK